MKHIINDGFGFSEIIVIGSKTVNCTVDSHRLLLLVTSWIPIVVKKK